MVRVGRLKDILAARMRLIGMPEMMMNNQTAL